MMVRVLETPKSLAIVHPDKGLFKADATKTMKHYQAMFKTCNPKGVSRMRLLVKLAMG
jgi:hypothetical protein